MLTPMGARILVRPDENPTETESGLHLVEHRKPETSGTVVKVPPRVACDCPDCGHRYFRSSTLAEGSTVVFSWQSGLEVFVDGDRFLLIQESDIAAVLEERT